MNREWLGTTEGSIPKEGRGLSDYERLLDFNRQDLIGKIVLDLGSGRNENFSRDLISQNIKSTVISLNPEYQNEKKRKNVSNLSDWQKNSVAGEGGALPFKDESFDQVLGVYSVSRFSEPCYLNWADEIQDMHSKLRQRDKEESLRWLTEISRVLKPGGQARLFPFKAESEEEFLVRYESFFASVRSANLKVDYKRIEDGWGVTYLVIITKPLQDSE